MKLYIKYLPLAMTLLFTVSACEKPLDLKPEGVVFAKDAIKNETDLKALLNSCYTVLGSGSFYGGRFQSIGELMADNLDATNLTTDFRSIYDRRTSIFGDYKNNFYSEPYIAVYRANYILENLNFADAQKNTIEGEAKFIRAICHFEIVRFFAQPYGFTADNSHPGVPIRLVTKPSAAVRATVKEVYDQIIKDLQEAENLLPDQNSVYPTKWSAKGFLARVYFQMNKFAEAYDYSNQVITSGKFTFDTDYSQRFSETGTPEAIFLLVSNGVNRNRSGELIGNFRSDINLPPLRVSPNFFTTAGTNANDNRRMWYNDSKYAGNIVTTKYNKDFFSVPVLHLTELKLIRAESAGELNQNLPIAIQDLNDIMNRAYGGTRTLPQNATASLIVTTARAERRLEMFGEGDRIHQLKRIGAKGESVTVKNAPWSCPGMVLQFPQGEIANSAGFQGNTEGGC